MHTVLWKRIDLPGHESARLKRLDPGWELSGSSVFLHEGAPVRLDYAIAVSPGFETRSASVRGWIGGATVDLRIEADGEGGWLLNGAPQPAVQGCVDIDLNFSPSTNLLPIRRLGLKVGERASVRAAWLRFPSLTLEPLEQTYIRLEERLYRYESTTGFSADLPVDPAGFPIDYPPSWSREG